MSNDPRDPRRPAPASVSLGRPSPRRVAPPLRSPDSIQWGTETPPDKAKPPQPPAAVRVGTPSGPPTPVRRAPPPPARPATAPAPRFVPVEPRTWEAAGVDKGEGESLILRFLRTAPRSTVQRVSEAVCLARPLVAEVLEDLKRGELLAYRGTTALGDFFCELTVNGRERANAARTATTYVGPAPVPWADYKRALEQQSLKLRRPGPEDLDRAFRGLTTSEDLLDRLGPAINACKPIFLHGEPGNGKTSLAERITGCFGGGVWIPYTLEVEGNLVSLFDPALHEPIEPPADLRDVRPDRRWAYIERPTVVVGGELTLDMLDLVHDEPSNVSTAPLQLKASLGTLVIDDFGRGKTSAKELLNRWIFPLEKGVDFLRLPDGRKLEVPFDCLLAFSTNLEPRDLADEAFMRRIPYKVYVGDPDETEFTELLEKLAEKMGVQLTPNSVKYLIDRHFKLKNRPMRFCHPRDLLEQVVSLCAFHGKPAVADPPVWDQVVQNYFGLM